MESLSSALPALGDAVALIFQPTQMLYLIAGVLLGLSVGIFPGLGGIAGLSLVLPFLYGMDPVSGLALMVGLVAVIPTSDTFSSVLMGIPGSSASQATVLDGFPLAKSGQAARALSAAFASSLFGGLFGAVVLTFFILIARPIVLAFGLPELLMLTLLGFAMVGVLSGRSFLKGFAACGLGLSVGAIGEAPAQGSPRMDYGFWYLQDGFQLVIVGLSIFAIPEIVSLMRKDTSISGETGLGAGWLQGVRDWARNIWLCIRCSTIGVIVGVIPGLGGSVVDWIAYGHTVQTTRDREMFGKGEIRGVIGPESSNNAKEGGGLVPTLLFGIPGSGSMAIFIGGMILLGYESGPQMIKNNLDITYTVVWSLALANVIGAGLCILLAGQIAKLTTVRFPILVPFLFMMIAFAAFQSRQTLWDLVALVGLGLVGIYMRRFDWSRPAFLIGFVLASQAEVYAYQLTQITSIRFRRSFEEGLDYLLSPIALVLLAVIIVSVWLGARQSQTIRPADEFGENPGWRKAPGLVFASLIAAFLVVFLIDVMQVGPLNDRVFPMVVGAATLLATLLLIGKMIVAPASNPLFWDGEVVGEDAEAEWNFWPMFAWLLGLIGLTALFGFVIAITIFFVIFLRVQARLGWGRIAILTVAGVGFLLFIASALYRDFPPGLLQSLVDLPWPLRGR